MYKNVISGPRRSGKSTALMKMVIDALDVSEQIVVVAPNYETLRYLAHLLEELLDCNLIKRISSPSIQFTLEGGQIIKFLDGSTKVYKGSWIDFLAIDEHTFVPDEFKSGILPCMRPYGRIWMTEYDKTGSAQGELTHEEIYGVENV